MTGLFNMTQCTVCNSPHRASIELGLANKVPLRTVAKRYGISYHACHRHLKNHMPPQLIAQLLTREPMTEIDLEKLRVTESEGLLHCLVAQRGRLYKLADEAETLGDIRAASGVHGQISRNLELTGKLLGDIRAGTTNITQNVLVNPVYHQVRMAVVQALRPHPEARIAVTEALQSMEAQAEHDALPEPVSAV